MIKKLLILLVIVLITGSTGFAQTTVNLSPDRYNTIYSEGNLANGAGAYFFCGRTAQKLSTDVRRGLLYFDLSSLPAGATIDTVILSMAMNKTRAASKPVSLYEVTTDWGSGASNAIGNEGKGTAALINDATWACTFSDGAGGCTSSWTSTGGDFNASALSTTAVVGIATYTWGSTSLNMLAQSWYDAPSGNFGIIVLGDESTITTAKRFTASTISLAVTYTAPIVTTVTADPVDSTVCDGFNGAFSITSDNANTHQWQEFNTSVWSNLSDGGVYGGTGTTTLSLTGVGAAMNMYQYRCIAIGTDNNDTSAAATLTVGVIPAVNLLTSDTTICLGDSILLTATNGGSSQWYFDGTIISGATSSSYMVTQGGNYNMLKTNVLGCSDSAATGTMVSIGAIPGVTISPSDTMICTEDSVLLTGANGGTLQWYLNGTAISGANSNVYVATEEGNYNMIKTNMLGCSDSASAGTVITVDSCLVEGLEQGIGSNDFLSVYPNPATSELHIQLVYSGFDQIGEVEILDALGRVVQNQVGLGGFSIMLPVQELERGMYVVRVISKSGKNTFLRTVILR